MLYSDTSISHMAMLRVFENVSFYIYIDLEQQGKQIIVEFQEYGKSAIQPQLVRPFINQSLLY